MAQVSNTIELPELPPAIRDRIGPYHADFDIEGNLRILENMRPWLFAAMDRMIAELESSPGITETSIDYDEEDALRPVTVWAESTFSLDERERQLHHIFDLSEDVLGGFQDLVLVGVM